MDIFTAFGLSASAGLNAYIPLLVVALMARFTDWITLRPPWDTLSNSWIIGVLLVLSLVEFFADKMPAINHVNDAIQTFVRPAAGAIVFAASTSLVDMSPVLAMAAGLLVAGTVHTAKAAAVRPMITATTGGTANTPVSLLEDMVSTVLSILAVIIPVLIAALVILMLTTLIWWLWRRANRAQTV